LLIGRRKRDKEGKKYEERYTMKQTGKNQRIKTIQLGGK
jgi:hypothetical protein